MRMYPSGNHINIREPDPSAIDIRDIAHGLATLNRFGGRARYPISVAEHSVMCKRTAEATLQSVEVQRALLLHDAGEAYVGELSCDLKHLDIMEEFRWLELRWLEAVWSHVRQTIRVEIAAAHLPAVRRIDKNVGDHEAEWLLSGNTIHSSDGREVPWVWVTAEEAFLREAYRLGMAERPVTVAEAVSEAFDP